jgi:adenylate cyclase
MSVGEIEVSARYQYRAVGDIVNTAARIQGLNRQLGTRALVSRDALSSLGGLETRLMGEFLLYGKTNVVMIYELLRPEARATAASRQRDDTFASALRAFQKREWAQARTQFRRVLDLSPGDGPSRFYLHQCDLMEGADLPQDWAGTIRLSVK